MNMYKTAFYIRLSKETKNTKEHETSKYQEKVLRDYISDKDEFELVDVYADIGYSGASPLRPWLIRLRRDIDCGKINCVIVKDLSRVGRDYMEVGDFMDQIILAGGRLLSVDNGYDSLSCTSLERMEVGAVNILSSLTLGTISRKVRQTTRMKRERGDYPSGPGPYGYQKDSADRNHLVIDREVAPVVKEIFEMRLKGETLKDIAKILSDNHVPTPEQHRSRKSEKDACEAKWNHNIPLDGVIMAPEELEPVSPALSESAGTLYALTRWHSPGDAAEFSPETLGVSKSKDYLLKLLSDDIAEMDIDIVLENARFYEDRMEFICSERDFELSDRLLHYDILPKPFYERAVEVSA